MPAQLETAARPIHASSLELYRTAQHIEAHACFISGVSTELLQNAIKATFPVAMAQYGAATTRVLQHTFGQKTNVYERNFGEEHPITKYLMTRILTNTFGEKYTAVTAAIDNMPFRIFGTQEQRQAALTRETGSKHALSACIPSLEEGLVQFARTYWGDKADEYMYVLGVITTKANIDYTPKRRDNQGVTRDKIFAALQEGRIEEARMLVDRLFGTTS